MTSVQEETGFVLLINKGKRTKRQRSISPFMNAQAVSGVCSEEEEASEVEFRGDVEEDEEMVNCLMLLSQGHKAKSNKIGFLSNKKPVSSLGLGLDSVYQCKTCDKSFLSFQALGGHRASHKKPKLEGNVLKFNEKKTVVETMESSVVGSFLSLQVPSNDGGNKKVDKTHECSICKAEFSSGQALGGHMRRHRGLTVNTSSIKTSSSESIRPKKYLELDLNLPAPEDEPKFVFASKDQILHFAAASNSLINCHH